jgi:hypothetical protein
VARTRRKRREAPELDRDGRVAGIRAANFLAPPLFNHLVRKRQRVDRHGEPHRLGGVEIEDKVISGGRLQQQVGRFAFENAVDLGRGLSERLRGTCSIRNQAAFRCE